MNVQYARGVATIALSEAEVRRLMAQSRVIVDDMRRALREAMELTTGKRKRRASRRNPRDARHAFLSPGLRRRSTS
jgi:hypothetical protein